MSAQNDSNPAEPRDLNERLAELRAKGIISDGEGPQGSIWPVTDLSPEAWKRLLDQRYRDYREPNQE